MLEEARCIACDINPRDNNINLDQLIESSDHAHRRGCVTRSYSVSATEGPRGKMKRARELTRG